LSGKEIARFKAGGKYGLCRHRVTPETRKIRPTLITRAWHPDLDQRRAGMAAQEDTASSPWAVGCVRDTWMFFDHHQAARAMQQQGRRRKVYSKLMQ